MHHRLQHGDLEQLALAGASPLDQCGHGSHGGVDAGHGVGHGRPQQARVARVGGDAQEARERLGDGIVARPVGVGPVLTEAGDRDIDQARVDRLQLLVVGPHARGRAGPEVLDVDVGLGDQLAEHLRVRRFLEVQADRALAAIVGLEVRRIEAASEVAVGVADLGAFDLDHVGAKVGQGHGRAWPGDEGPLFEDPDPIQWLLDHLPIRTQFSSAVKPSGATPS